MKSPPSSGALSPVRQNMELHPSSDALPPVKGVPPLPVRMARRRSGVVSRFTELPPPYGARSPFEEILSPSAQYYTPWWR